MQLRRKDFAQFAVLARIAGAALAAGVVCAAARALLQDPAPLLVLAVCALVYGAAYAGAILAAGVLDAAEWSTVRGVVRYGWTPARRNVAC